MDHWIYCGLNIPIQKLLFEVDLRMNCKHLMSKRKLRKVSPALLWPALETCKKKTDTNKKRTQRERERFYVRVIR